MRLNILVLGLGSIGTRHLTNLYLNSQAWGVDNRVFIDDIDQERVRKTLASFGHWTGVASRAQGWNEGVRSYDVALICTPPSAEYEVQARYALIEKPMRNPKMGISKALMMLRFHPGVKWMKENLPTIGTPLYGRASYSYRLDKQRSDFFLAPIAGKYSEGGGALNNVLHDLDALMWVLGCDVNDMMEESIGHIFDSEGKTNPKLYPDIKHDYLDVWGHWSGVDTNQELIVEVRGDFFGHQRARSMRVVGTEGELGWVESGAGDPFLSMAQVNRDGSHSIHSFRYNINDMYVAELGAFLTWMQVSRGELPTEDDDRMQCPLPGAATVVKESELLHPLS